jgi:glycine/D-amino acid oxidase-like deaminating enzyme
MSSQRRIVVCGAGVIGAAVAYFLTLRGAPPIVVERARPGAAASGRAGGFLALDRNDDSPIGPLARASYALHRQLAGDLGPGIGYREVETLMVAGMDQGSVEDYRRLPNPDWLDGNVALHSVIGTTATTAQVNPMQFTNAMIDGAVVGGAELRIGTVGGLDLTGPAGAVQGVVVDGETVPADVVVLALGPWMSRAQAWLPLPMIHALKGASITLAADVPAQAVFGDYRTRDGRHMSPEIYPRPGGEVYVNGFPENDPLPDNPDDVAPSDLACDELHRVAGAHSSLLAAAEVTSRRACYRPVTIDGIPLIGPVASAPGVYVATGHASWGILLAPATGRVIAEMILDGRSHSVDAAPFAVSRLASALM